MAACSETGTTVNDLITRASRLLNDYEEGGAQFVRWTKVSLLDSANEAIAQLSAHRRDAFTSQEVLTLEAGAQQRLPDCFLELVKLDRNAARGADGSIIYGTQISEQDQRFASVLRKKPCLSRDAPCGPAQAYCVGSFARNQSNTSTFDVFPPVPYGVTPEVAATVVRKPVRFGVGDYAKELGLKPEFEAAVIDWMLYRAFSIDTESPTAIEIAKRYETSFYNLLGIQKKNRADFNTDRRANLPAPSSPTVRYRPRSDMP